MNRLSPLIVRRVGSLAGSPPSAGSGFDELPVERWTEDLKLFATGWLGGLVFFGTYLA